MMTNDDLIWRLLIKKDERFSNLRTALSGKATDKFLISECSDIAYYIHQQECPAKERTHCLERPKITPKFEKDSDGKIIKCGFTYQFCIHFQQKKNAYRKMTNLLLDQTNNHFHKPNSERQVEAIKTLAKKLLESDTKLQHVIAPKHLTTNSKKRYFFGEVTQQLIHEAASRDKKIAVLQTIVLQQIYYQSFTAEGKQEIKDFLKKISAAKVIIVWGIGDEAFSYAWAQFFLKTILWGSNNDKNLSVIFLGESLAASLGKRYYDFYVERERQRSWGSASYRNPERKIVIQQIKWFVSFIFDNCNYQTRVYRYVSKSTGNQSDDLVARFWTCAKN